MSCGLSGRSSDLPFYFWLAFRFLCDELAPGSAVHLVTTDLKWALKNAANAGPSGKIIAGDKAAAVVGPAKDIGPTLIGA